MRTGCSDVVWLLRRCPAPLPQLTFCPGQSHMFLATDGLGFGVPKDSRSFPRSSDHTSDSYTSSHRKDSRSLTRRSCWCTCVSVF